MRFYFDFWGEINPEKYIVCTISINFHEINKVQNLKILMLNLLNKLLCISSLKVIPLKRVLFRTTKAKINNK